MNNRFISFEYKGERKEMEPEIEILNAREAVPEDVKKNPFYNPYFWCRADWEEKKLYLPESDEALSISIASHELGHLVNKGRIIPDRRDFSDSYQEEIRAWQLGWGYFKKYLNEYYKNEPDMVEKIAAIKEEIESIMMEITKLSEPFFSTTDKGDDESLLQNQRVNFLKTEIGRKLKEMIDNLEQEVNKRIEEFNEPRLKRKVDWDRFLHIIKMTLHDIEKDNKQYAKEIN